MHTPSAELRSVAGTLQLSLHCKVTVTPQHSGITWLRGLNLVLPRNEAPQKLPQPTHREVTACDSASAPFQVSASCQHFAHTAAVTWGEGAATKQWVLPSLPAGTLLLKRSGHGVFVNLSLKAVQRHL